MDSQLFRKSVKEQQVLLLCERICGYRGLERSTPYANKLFPCDSIKEIMYMVDENGDIPYSHENFRKLHMIQQKLAGKGLELDIILAGVEPQDSSVYKSSVFLGYDVSGDSLSHSLIYRSYFDNPHFISDYFAEFSNYLNENGLFSDISAANKFINCTAIHPQIFENDGNVAPVAIWELAQ